jgi:hypothetical protein
MQLGLVELLGVLQNNNNIKAVIQGHLNKKKRMIF